MPFFVYGNDSKTGEVMPRIFSGAATVEDARQHGEAHGMQVTATVPCSDTLRPVDKELIATRLRVETRKAPAVDSEVAEFGHQLDELTPNTYVVYALVAANVLVFVAMTLAGANADHPATRDLLRWGADFGPWTTDGQWWRLFTSNFVHIGLIHLLNNMVALGYIGASVERLIGNVGFLLLYVVAGLAGSLLSLYLGPMYVHAGASGAIFGIYGGLLAILLRVSVPEKIRAVQLRFVLIFIVFNLINSLRPGVGFAAHFGGFVMGFLCGLVLAQPAVREALDGRPARNFAVLGFGLVLMVAGIAGLDSRFSNLGALQQVLARFDALDQKVLNLAAYGDRDPLNTTALNQIKTDILPPWKELRSQLEAFKPVPTGLGATVDQTVTYMRLRQESWEVLLDAPHMDDAQWQKESTAKRRAADGAERDLNRIARPRLLPAN